MARKQEFPAADSFLSWNADDVRAIRARQEVLSAPFQTQAARGSQETATGPAYPRAPGEVRSYCVFIFGSGVTSDIKLGSDSGWSLAGSLTGGRTGLQRGVALWLLPPAESTGGRACAGVGPRQ